MKQYALKKVYIFKSFFFLKYGIKIKSGAKVGRKALVLIYNYFWRNNFDKGRYFRRVHQLVAKAFLSNPNNYEVVNHMDGNIKNNHFTNLEWCTAAYNTRYSYTHLGRKGNHTTDIKCKLKVDNELVGEFHSIKEAAEYANKHYKTSKSSLISYYKSGNVSIEKCND